MKSIYLWDLDGTLANLEHRLHFIKQDKPDWDGFFKACGEDEAIQENIGLFQDLKTLGHVCWIVSGRSDAVRETTEAWLDANFVFHDKLFMRKAGDHRPDTQIKKEILDSFTQSDRSLIKGVFDDRASVVKMWRNEGLTCYQVADGRF